MTDNEIIKALEDKTHKAEYPWVDSSYCDVEVSLLKNTLDLINRQQAEIEELKISTGLMNNRKFYRKFVDEVFRKQKGKELSTPDFDYIYELYFKQQAEIERLKAEILILSQKRANIFEIVNANEKGRARGIKEFAERLKAEYSHTLLPPMGYPIDKNDWIVYRKDVDDLVKEMIGENK